MTWRMNLKFYKHFNLHLSKHPLLFGAPKRSPLLLLIAILISKDVDMGHCHIFTRLFSKNSLFLHYLNLAKLHQKIFAQQFFNLTILCFSNLFKTCLVMTFLWILLGYCLSPMHLKTTENHWIVVIFSLEICKSVFMNVTSETLSSHIMFVAFSFCVYYKAVSIWKQIKR